jgi:hypothetical protein
LSDTIKSYKMDTVEYLNSTVWATVKPSPVHGVGVIAIRDIPKGTRYTDFQMLGQAAVYTLERTAFNRLLPEIRELILDRSLVHAGLPIIFTSPNAQADLRAFMNHGSTPNTDGFVTLRDIKAGEELTEDYTSFGELSTISREHYDSFL